MVALVGTLEARALELGWRVVGERRVRVGARSLLETRWIFECLECLARVCRGKRWFNSGSSYAACHHPVVDEVTPWEEDVVARLLVERLGAMTLEEVGESLGVTRERVRQIESKALRRLRRRLEADGMDADDLRDLFAALAAGTDRVASATEHVSEKGGGRTGDQHDRRVALTKWIDPDELAERVRERAEAAAQVDAALALARAPREEDEPATPAKEERAMPKKESEPKVCARKGCGKTFAPDRSKRYCSVECRPASTTAAMARAAHRKKPATVDEVAERVSKRSRSQARRIDSQALRTVSARVLLEHAGYKVREVLTPAGPMLLVDEPWSPGGVA